MPNSIINRYNYTLSVMPSVVILLLLTISNLNLNAHNVNAISYVKVEIFKNQVRFLNLENENIPNHIFYAGYTDIQKEFKTYIQVENNKTLCTLKNFAIHEDDSFSKAPYMFIAYCDSPITELYIKDTFPIEGNMNKTYTFLYKDTSLTVPGGIDFIGKIQIQKNDIILLESNDNNSNDSSYNYNSTNNSTNQPKKISKFTNNLKLFFDYTVLGLEHILLGLDHILFILGFILLASSFSGLIKGISGFTVSHSITLTLAALSIVSLSSHIVEPLIALSIAVVGLLAMFDLAKQWILRFGIIFGFGLFHGLGFAGSIAEVGFPKDGFVAALLGFNIGIEIGQLLITFVVFPLLNRLKQRNNTHYKVVLKFLSITIIASGCLWFIQRTFILI